MDIDQDFVGDIGGGGMDFGDDPFGPGIETGQVIEIGDGMLENEEEKVHNYTLRVSSCSGVFNRELLIQTGCVPARATDPSVRILHSPLYVVFLLLGATTSYSNRYPAAPR